jgi:hypothetical protein
VNGLGLAVVLAAVSLVCLALAADAWLTSRAEPPAGRSEPGVWRGNLILLAVSLFLLGGLWTVAEPFGWRRDRALWVGFGAFLALMTVTRPWWFWEHYKARWLRNLIGDEPTALIYLLLAGVMVWVGLFTEWSFGRR